LATRLAPSLPPAVGLTAALTDTPCQACGRARYTAAGTCTPLPHAAAAVARRGCAPHLAALYRRGTRPPHGMARHAAAARAAKNTAARQHAPPLHAASRNTTAEQRATYAHHRTAVVSQREGEALEPQWHTTVHGHGTASRAVAGETRLVRRESPMPGTVAPRAEEYAPHKARYYIPSAQDRGSSRS